MGRVVQLTRSRPPAVALMTLAAFSWGMGIVMTKITLEQLTPLDVLGTELVVGAGVVWAVLLARGRRGAFAGWPAFALLGLLEPGLSYALGDFGLDRTGAVDAAFLLAPESLFAVLLAWLVLNERMSRRVAVAVGVGFAGSVVIGLGAVGGMHPTLVGDALVLGSSVAAALYSVLARRVARGGQIDALMVTAVQLMVATVVTLPLIAIATAEGSSQIGDADTAHLLAAIATGLLTTGLPFLLFNVAIRDVQVAGGALILNLIPVVAVVLAVVLLGEALGALEAAGGIAVVAAAFAAESPVAVPH